MGKIDPLDDIATINTELYTADLETVAKALLRLTKQQKVATKMPLKPKRLWKKSNLTG